MLADGYRQDEQAAAKKFSATPSHMATRSSRKAKNCGVIAKARNQTSGFWLCATPNSTNSPMT